MLHYNVLYCIIIKHELLLSYFLSDLYYIKLYNIILCRFFLKQIIPQINSFFLILSFEMVLYYIILC